MQSVLAIAHYTLQGSVLLAPMAGVSDWPWRSICQHYGAALTSSEMLTANHALWHSEKSRLRMNSGEGLVPNSVQIVGSDPQQMADAAKYAVDAGAALIDINMGCPAKKVCKKAAGSALLQDTGLVEKILQTVVNAVPVPVTLKIRTGWDQHSKNAVQVGIIAEQAGIQALVIHGRTRACRFNGSAEYDTIRAVKHVLGIPVIANGDIDSVARALEVRHYTGADGLMLGRAVQGRPWLISQVNDALAGRQPQEPCWQEKLHCMEQHMMAIHQFYGEQKGLGFARKHMAFYLEHLQLYHYRSWFNHINNAASQLEFIRQLRNDFVEGSAA